MFYGVFWQDPVTMKPSPNTLYTPSALLCQSLLEHAHRPYSKSTFLPDANGSEYLTILSLIIMVVNKK